MNTERPHEQRANGDEPPLMLIKRAENNRLRSVPAMSGAMAQRKENGSRELHSGHESSNNDCPPPTVPAYGSDGSFGIMHRSGHLLLEVIQAKRVVAWEENARLVFEAHRTELVSVSEGKLERTCVVLPRA